MKFDDVMDRASQLAREMFNRRRLPTELEASQEAEQDKSREGAAVLPPPRPMGGPTLTPGGSGLETGGAGPEGVSPSNVAAERAAAVEKLAAQFRAAREANAREERDRGEHGREV
ncbi:MAG: hypothetical protein AAGK22_29990 [Acidobacteriota bacterium]